MIDTDSDFTTSTCQGRTHHFLPLAEASILPMMTPVGQMQRVGETLFAATLLLSILQATVAIYQYRSNPRGELAVPPGLTIGIEEPYEKQMEKQVQRATQLKIRKGSRLCRLVTAPAELEEDNRANESNRHSSRRTKKEPPLNRDKLDNIISSSHEVMASLKQMHKSEKVQIQKSQSPSFYARAIFRLNKMAVLLLPWIAKRVHYLLVRNSHLFHILLIISLANTIDFWRPNSLDKKAKNSIENNETDGKPNLNNEEKGIIENKRELRLVVIGDSLAIGIGCVEEFDTSKNATAPICRVERTSLNDQVHQSEETRHTMGNKSNKTKKAIGPIFPKVFAKTLSEKLQRRVRWRSAGCDGGSVKDIHQHCSGVIREECAKGRPPDIVIVICGMNDLKKSLSIPNLISNLNLFQKNKSSVHGFRASMTSLIQNIHGLVPDANIIFPALPVQTFHKNSAVNVIPLAIFLDLMIGYWDYQKKSVADKNKNVMYFGLTPREILGWYNAHNNTTTSCFDGYKKQCRSEIDDGEDNTILIAPDGIHPNKLCYEKWAESMANKFCDFSNVKHNTD